MKIALTFTLLILNSFLTFSQEEKIIIIDKGGSKKTKSTIKRELVDNDHVLKFSVFQMLANEINIGYEKKIDEMSSFEISAGPTISNIGFSVNDNHYNNYPNQNTNETSALGMFISAGYRFYPMDNGKVLNNFYISPEVKYRRMNFGIVDYSDNLSSTKGYEDHTYFTFNFGMQTWLSERFSIDYFAGIGLGYESHVRYNVVSSYNPDTYLYEYYWEKNAYSGAKYLFTLGLKVGIGN